jgi:hypothetical protein
MTHSITLQSPQSSVVNGTILGRLGFAAPNESSGGISTNIAASLIASAESNFTNNVAPTSLILCTSDSDGNLIERVKVNSIGDFIIGPGIGRSPSLRLFGSSILQYHDINSVSGNGISISSGGSTPHNFLGILGHSIRSNSAYYWTNSSTNATTGTPDLFLYREAAGVLAQRNSTSAQTLRLYGSYTDSANYVRLRLNCTSTQANIIADTAGNGADNINLIINPAGTGNVQLAGTTSASSAGFSVGTYDNINDRTLVTTINNNGFTTNFTISNNTDSGGIVATKESSRGDSFHVGSIDIDGQDIIDPETEEVIATEYRPTMEMHVDNFNGFYLEKNNATVFQFNPNSDQWTVANPDTFRQAIDLYSDDDVWFNSLSLNDESSTEEDPLGPGVLTVNSGQLLFNNSPIVGSSSFSLLSEESGILNIEGGVYVSGALYDSFFSPGLSGQVLTSTVSGIYWKSLSEITGVDGSGTENYIAKWSDTDSITNSQIFDNGTNVGIGTDSPSAKFHVAGNIVGSGGVVTSNIPVLDLSQTWNSGTVNFTGLLLNINDTVSNTGSSLVDVKRNNISLFKIERPDGSNNYFIKFPNNTSFSTDGNDTRLRFVNQTLTTDNSIAWPAWASDTAIIREEASTLAQRFGANAQTFRLYCTFTDSSNYERLALRSGSYSTKSHFIIAAETAGTGTDNIDLVLSPAGNGALIVGPPPDGTSVGGNARGDYAIDIQGNRSGSSQVASGSESISIGNSCTANSIRSLGIGWTAAATGQWGIAIGVNVSSAGDSVAIGRDSSATGAGGVALGSLSVANRQNMLAFGGFSNFGSAGDSQLFLMKLQNKTTTSSPTELFANGTTTRVTVSSGKVVSCIINVTGVKSDGSAVAHFVRQYAVKNVGGTTSEVYAPVTVGSDNPAGCDVIVSADNTNDSLKIEVVGIAGETWRWIATINGSELNYGT